jgi:hypothetical protein
VSRGYSADNGAVTVQVGASEGPSREIDERRDRVRHALVVHASYCLV